MEIFFTHRFIIVQKPGGHRYQEKKTFAAFRR
jgi:hypothetical protein